jgi:hypothetical protein
MNRALLVGINRYPNAPLHGCVNDVTDIADFIVKVCGFSEEDVRLLVDDRATTDAIRERLGWLVGGVRPGDRLLFHYSGHGTQMAPRNRAGTVTSLHDAICPVDFDFTLAHALTDDDFRAIFAGVPQGTEFNWVSDSCNSGDLARAIVRGTPRSYPVPADIQWHIVTAKKNRMEAPGFRSAVEHLSGALIAGCRSDQTSADADFNEKPNGAFTYFLLQALREPKGLSEPLAALVERTTRLLDENGYAQQPQLQGDPRIVSTSFLAATSVK